VYKPYAFATAHVHLVDTRKGLEYDELLSLIAQIGEDAGVSWDAAQPLTFTADELESSPAEGVTFEPLPGGAGSKDAVKDWGDALDEELYRKRRFDLFEYDALDLYSEPGESERDFRIRISDAIRVQRDAAVAELREKYSLKLERQEERIRKAEQKVTRESEQADAAKMQSMVSAGSTLLSVFLGRKFLSRTTVGRATTAMRGVVRGRTQAGDVDRAVADLESVGHEMDALQLELGQAVEELKSALDPMNVELSTTTLKPRRTDIDIRFVALTWAPFRDGEPAWV
jgi:hypothetical protein